MTRSTRSASVRGVNHPPAGARRYVAALVVFLAAIFAPLGARAASESFDVGEQGFVQIRAIKGEITVRTWDKPTVQIDTDDDFVGRKAPVRYGSPDVPFDIPMRAQPIPTITGIVQLPPESFVIANLKPTQHDGIYIEGKTGTATVTVPANLGMLVVAMRGGPSHVDIDGVKSATMIVALRGGAARFHDVGGDGFVQVLNGRVTATNSNFNRIRVRTVNDSVVFERCSAKQIEASSVHGSVVYDNGQFVPGQARFESTFGNVLIGLGRGGGAQLSAHSGTGKIYSNFTQRNVALHQRDSDATATVHGGGPLVNLSSEHGSIYLYDGAIEQKRDSPDWHEGTARVNAPLPANRSARGLPANPRERVPNGTIHASETIRVRISVASPHRF